MGLIELNEFDIIFSFNDGPYFKNKWISIIYFFLVNIDWISIEKKIKIKKLLKWMERIKINIILLN